jgi:hypothetical protein
MLIISGFINLPVVISTFFTFVAGGISPMGEAELLKQDGLLIIHSVFFFYGDAASHDLAHKIALDISDHWNEPAATVTIRHALYSVKFNIEGFYTPDLNPESVWYNDNPRFNYFRIEGFANGNISFVDGVNSNTGYFLLDNLLQTSTTAAHEYGHTLGLDHPASLDIRGRGIPGIMYPRGTVCDLSLQYDPLAEPGKKGGTLQPHFRKVMQHDIDSLKLARLSFNSRGIATVGGFSSMYHEKHIPPAE